MEAYLPISYLNDFIFCPRSIYFHQLYGAVDTRLYQSTDQIDGKAAHKTLDSKSYTTAKAVLQTIEVFSDKYKIGGKIDSYDQQRHLLVERKRKITTIYDGYIYQLYAQYHCLIEMGYRVEKIKLYSLIDNKSYPIAKPEEDPERQKGFEALITQIRSHKLNGLQTLNKNKCDRCIYSPLCDVSLC